MHKWKLYFDDWNEVLMDRHGKFLRIAKVTHFMNTLGKNY